MKCARCGAETPRLTLAQTRDPKCQREVEALIAMDDRRRSRKVGAAKDFTGTTAL